MNQAAPTAAELRRLAIFSNYTALVDVSPRGGYGTQFGPNIDVAGNDTLGEGKVAGTEYLAFSDDGSGRNVTLMVQIPATWNRDRPCSVTATSSGSRGVYGAIGTAGEWGLKRGCAVAYADKGTGPHVHDLATNTVTVNSSFTFNIDKAALSLLPSLNLVGNNCHGATPISVNMSGPVNLTGSSTFSATYTIPKFAGCGLLVTPILNLIIPGPGNTFTATFAPPA